MQIGLIGIKMKHAIDYSIECLDRIKKRNALYICQVPPKTTPLCSSETVISKGSKKLPSHSLVVMIYIQTYTSIIIYTVDREEYNYGTGKKQYHNTALVGRGYGGGKSYGFLYTKALGCLVVPLFFSLITIS